MAERIHGVNLSGWFIPETWVTPSLFAATGAANALELQRALGTAVYSERLRHHFETFITEDDFRRIAAIGFNSVRIPVPWHVFGAREDAFTNIPAIDYVDRAIEWAEKYELSVLLSLATVPGGQGDSNESLRPPRARRTGIPLKMGVTLRLLRSRSWPLAMGLPRPCWESSCWTRRW